MPILTVYTDPSKLGTCDVPPFVVGDATNQWTLKFHNGTAYYAPSSVGMRIGNINGLTAAQSAAFKWYDRAGNSGVFDIGLTSNVPSLTLASSSGTAPTLTGSNGVYIIRGVRGGQGQSVKRIDIISAGRYNTASSTVSVVINGGGGSGAAATVTIAGAVATGVTLTNGGSGYITPPGVFASDPGTWVTVPQFAAILSDALSVTPYKTDEASQAVIGALDLVPYSDGRTDASGTTQYDHSLCVIKPRDVATATLSLSGSDWVGTMDPINNWVSAVLALRRSVALDLQIFGDGRMLFQGVLVILNKIA